MGKSIKLWFAKDSYYHNYSKGPYTKYEDGFDFWRQSNEGGKIKCLEIYDWSYNCDPYYEIDIKECSCIGTIIEELLIILREAIPCGHSCNSCFTFENDNICALIIIDTDNNKITKHSCDKDSTMLEKEKYKIIP